MEEGNSVGELDSSMQSIKISSGKTDCHDNDVWGDEYPWDGSDDLDREWKRRREEFYNMGYREGAADGNRDAAQEGFNKGFKESILLGHRWGLVRGVTSALVYLPEQLKETMVETEAKRREVYCFSKSVQSLSAADALKVFYEDLKKNSAEGGDSSNEHNQSSDFDLLESHFRRLQSFLSESSTIAVHLDIDHRRVPCL